MDKKAYQDLYELEERHWWFRGRRRIIFDVLRRVLPQQKLGSALDIGCGTGLNTVLLKEVAWRVIGLEMSDEVMVFSRERAHEIKIVKGEFPHDAPRRTFDVVTLLDVFEHFEDDTAALKRVYSLLEKDGYVAITVPAFSFLWSEHDDLAHHKRRYTKRMLEERLRDAGFDIVRLTYFNSFLFPVVAAVRLVKKIFGIRIGATDFFMPLAPVNAVLAALFGSERLLLRYMNFPFGVSIIAIAQKARG